MAILDIFTILLVTTIWGLNFAISKIGMDQLPPLFLSAARFSLVALAAFFIPRPKIDWRIYTGIGLFIGVFKFSLLFVAIHIGLAAGLTSVIVQGQVFFTIILTYFLYGEKLRPYQIIGLIIGMTGLVIMGFDEGRDFDFIGFLMVVLAAMCWGIANMFFRKTGDADGVSVIVWASVVAAGPIWILSFTFEGPDLIAQTITHFGMTSVFVVLYIAILSTLFCYSAWGKMLSKYPAANVTPFALLIPVSGLLGGLLIVDEAISAVAQIGILVIMIGLLITVLGGKIRKMVASQAH